MDLYLKFKGILSCQSIYIVLEYLKCIERLYNFKKKTWYISI